MKRFASGLLLIGCFALGLGHAITREEINYTNVYLDFVDPDLSDVGKQLELKRGVILALSMWETVLPDLHFTITTNPHIASLVFRFDDFNTYSDPANCGQYTCRDLNKCRSDFAGGFVNNGLIEINTRLGCNDINLEVDQFDFIARDDIWSTYEPATHVPYHYLQPGLAASGYNDGYFRYWENKLVTEDQVHNMFHEFGHRMGGSDDVLLDDKTSPIWYGVPWRINESGVRDSLPQQPYFDPDNHPERGLQKMAEVHYPYFGAGSNSGTYDNRPDNPNRWHAHLRWSLMKDLVSHMHYSLGDENGRGSRVTPYGIPRIYLGWGNHRIVNPGDMAESQVERERFPGISGTIRMLKKRGDVYLTADWKDARSKAELDKDYQTQDPVWGYDPYFVNAVFPKAQAHRSLAAGNEHALGLRDNGKLYAWGRNDYGQIGNNSTTASPNPVNIAGDWVAVSAGETFSAGIKRDGSLWTWGRNNRGQLGIGSLAAQSSTPVQVNSNGAQWHAVACGWTHVLAIRKDGTLWAWGYGDYGQLGDGKGVTKTSPVQVKTPPGYQGNEWVAVSGGATHSVAMMADGTLWTWGSNAYGQLGTASSAPKSLEPVQIIGTPEATDWVAIEAGYNHTLALKLDGTAWAWGRNEYGQLGLGDQSNRNEPTQIVLPDGSTNFRAVSGGWSHSLIERYDGQVFACGKYSDGRLGLAGTLTANVTTPTALGGTEWDAIEAGGNFSLATQRTSKLFSWGSDAQGQLCDGTAGGTATTATHRANFAQEIMKVSFQSPGATTQTLTTSPVPILVHATGGYDKVEILEGTTVLKTFTAPPLSFGWKVPLGKHTLTAKATDKLGSVTSSSITVYSHQLDLPNPVDQGSATVDLSSAVDWVYCGRTSATSIDRKSGVNKIKSPKFPSNASRQTGLTHKFKWTTSTGTVDNVNASTVMNDGAPLDIDIPLTSASQTITLYFWHEVSSAGVYGSILVNGTPLGGIGTAAYPYTSGPRAYRVATFKAASPTAGAVLRVSLQGEEDGVRDGVQAITVK